MALSPGESNLGMMAPPFDLPDTNGERVALADYDDASALVVMFICNHCPYVKAVRQRLIDLARKRRDDGVAFVAIGSNDAQRYPEDGFERMKEVAEELGYPFPYLWDQTQEVAEAYGAVCTPDFFLFDGDQKLVYRGRLDDDWQDESNVTSHDLDDAIAAVLRGDEPPAVQKPSMGCSIKWRF